MRAHDFHDEVVKRLQAGNATRAQVGLALAVLYQICRNAPIGKDQPSPSDGVCIKSAEEIGQYLRIRRGEMPQILQALEEAGAIERIREGRDKVIRLTEKYLAAEKELSRRREFIIPWGTPPLISTVKTRMTELKYYWLDLREALRKAWEGK